MRYYLCLLLCCFSFSLFAQASAVSIADEEPVKQDVKFTSLGDTLVGTIFKPKHPYAALVIVHGSGQEKRSLQTASYFAKNGIMVLTYDKRGVGQSSGRYVGPEVGTNNVDSANLNLLAVDAKAAVDLLLKHLPAKGIPVGLTGFSQAGWVIPLAAKNNPKVNFMVIFSGPVVTTLQQLRFQFYTQGDVNFWDKHTEQEARLHTLNDPDKYQFKATDPTSTLAELSIPALWLFGAKDIQVPVGLSTANLISLKNKGKQYEFVLLPDLGHNTSLSKSSEPVNMAIKWIQTLSPQTKMQR